MTSRLHLVAICLIGLLVAAVPVSSQDVANMIGYGSPRLFDSFRDTSFRAADNGLERLEPSIELLPPVEQPQAISVGAVLPPRAATSGPTSSARLQGQYPAPAASAPEANGFELIQAPQPAAILGPEILAPVVAADGHSVTKKKNSALKIWSGNVELGLDGTEGNSQTFNFHIGFDLKRKTKCNIFTSSLDYNKTNSGSINTANRLFHESRLERPHYATPWTWYVHESTDYDEFQPWNVQINGDTGIGYQVIETDSTDLTSRFGGGCSHEIGGPDDAYVPELLFGVEFEHRMSDLQKLKLSLEYFPDVTDFAEFRMVDKASWEVLLDKKLNLSLSLNVTEIYNRPNPGGKEGDLDYSAVLLWNF